MRAIRYVLQNAAHHFAATGADPYSSAALPKEAPELAAPLGWLQRRGAGRMAPELLLRW